MTLGELHNRLEQLVMQGFEDHEVCFDDGADSGLEHIRSVSKEVYFDGQGGTIVRVILSK